MLSFIKIVLHLGKRPRKRQITINVLNINEKMKIENISTFKWIHSTFIIISSFKSNNEHTLVKLFLKCKNKLVNKISSLLILNLYFVIQLSIFILLSIRFLSHQLSNKNFGFQQPNGYSASNIFTFHFQCLHYQELRTRIILNIAL